MPSPITHPHHSKPDALVGFINMMIICERLMSSWMNTYSIYIRSK